MSTVAVLTDADIAVIFGDSAKVADLTATKPLSTLAVGGAGVSARLSPVGARNPEVAPITSSHNATATAYAGDAVDALSTISKTTGMVAVILGASGVGWVLPSAILDDPADDARLRMPNTDVQMVTLAFANNARGLIVRAAHELTADGSVTVTVGSGQSVVLALTTAGTVGSASRTVGVYGVTGVSGSVTVTGARGWILVVEPDVPGGA